MTELQSNVDARLRVSLNGELRITEARTLAELVVEAGFAEAKIATAINGVFVSQSARAERVLAEGDRVEIVSPRQGG